MNLAALVNNLPEDPGVYLMKDKASRIIYIGKAKSLRKRIRSYFREQGSAKTRQMVSKIADIDVIITPTELDALILESNLIKKHDPFYNLQLKDDKRYPYLKVTTNEEYPRLLIVRQYQEDGARYFGPFAGKGTVLRALKLLRTTFPLRQCSEKLPNRSCLELQIKRCLGPCIKKEVRPDYARATKELLLFLEGKYAELVAQLSVSMKEASGQKQFEKAAMFRDRIKKLEKIGEHQEMVLPKRADVDIMVFFTTKKEEGLDVLKVRGGKVLDNEVVFFDKNAEDDPEGTAVRRYYERRNFCPDKIIFEKELAAFPILKAWLDKKCGKPVQMECAPANELFKMVKRNIAFLKVQDIKEGETTEETLTELQQVLKLSYLPAYIECYDISNTGGDNIVGSQVVFIDGKAEKKYYRHYNVRTVQGKSDDVASLREVLARRCKSITERSLRPELIIIDGGKGQLAAAEEVLKNAQLGIPAISIAKKEEDIYYRGEKVYLPKDSKAQMLLQRIRDEAHRFGITFHRRKRGKSSLASVLNKGRIKGGGKGRFRKKNNT